MRKSSFGGFSGRVSSGPLRVKNDGGGGGPRKSTAGSHTPQTKRYSGASTYSSASTSRTRSVMGPSSSHGHSQRSNIPGMHRTSSIGAGAGAGSSSLGLRGSGIGVRNRTDVPKDPRPLSDKVFQHHCIRTLIDFLTESKYPHPLSQKVLMSPPSKEFFRMFEYIYSLLVDPSFKLGGKVEEEIPRLLKSLGYPFSISKSSMHAVGTPHTWPTLLATLIWLIELVKVVQGMDTSQLDQLMFPPEDEDFDSVPDDKIKFKYISQTYLAYMGGNDDMFEVFDEDLDKVLADKILGQSGGIEAIRAETARVAEEVELLDQEMGRVDKLQEQGEIMLLDEKKFRDYLNELENLVRKHQTLLTQAQDEHTSLDQELKAIQSKNLQMQALYEQQDLTLADVERLRAAKQELQRSEEGLEKEVEAIDSDIWKNEMSFARLLEQIDTSLGEYSRLARTLQLIPSTTSVANGINFELRSADPEFVQKFEEFKPALMAMKTKGKESLQRLEANQRRAESAMERNAEQIADTKAEIAQLEKDTKATDQEIECRKELYQRDIEHLQATVDRHQQDIRSQQTSSQISLQDTEQEMRDLVSWAQQKETEMKKTEQEYSTFLHSVCTLVADHKTHVRQQLGLMEREVGQVHTQEQDRWSRMQQTSQQLRDQCPQ